MIILAKKKCLWCNKRPVVLFGKYDEYSNACDVCVPGDKSRTVPLPGEWTRNAKVEVEAHSKETLQPTTKNGRINRHFIEVYGTKVLEREMKLSKREIMAQAE